MAGVGAALLFSLGELLPTAAPELLQQLRPKQSPSASERQEDAAPLEAELDEELEPFVAPPPPPPPPRTIGLVGGRRAGGALLALVGALLLLRWGWDLSPPPLPHVSLHSRQGGALRAAPEKFRAALAQRVATSRKGLFRAFCSSCRSCSMISNH